ncbi:MAG: zinc-binding alcohol dehydrogenase family protein [Elusimicrobia bacterium]|nr:zinc-binding alcohol dehydrogenase family protein [Elusimicrobiota bacterium]
MMRAWLLDKIGSLQNLRLGETAEPRPGEGEVLLRVEFASLNPADRYLAEALYPARPVLPHILGRDGLGTVVAVGPGVQGLASGARRVILRGEAGVNRPGLFAQYAAVPADCLAAPTPGWSPQQSAAAPLVYLTAYQALTMWGELPPSTVLVTGASGGVGVAAVHLARAMGHTVLAMSRDAGKAEKLRQQGAQSVVDPNDPQWPKRVKEFLKGGKVDLAVDTIGGESFNQVLETLGAGGKVSCVGRLAGPVPSFNTASLFFRKLRIGGVNVAAYQGREAHAAWDSVLKLLKKTGAAPLVDSEWEFERLPEAFARLAAGPMGKVVLKIAP